MLLVWFCFAAVKADKIAAGNTDLYFSLLMFMESHIQINVPGLFEEVIGLWSLPYVNPYNAVSWAPA